MKVFYHINDYIAAKNSVITTGTFDGVHLGHKTIIERLKKIAKKIDGETTILTFHPHPRLILFPNSNDLKLLNTPKEKIDLLEKAGIDNLIIHPFTKEFSKLSSVEFVRDILSHKLKTCRLVIGYDHRFGRNREGSFEHLKEFGMLYGFEVEEIPAQDIDNINISSTKIRTALNKGEVEIANKYLGYNFPITGKVIPGNQLGRTINFPTANILVENSHKMIPQVGSYCVKISINGISYNGMINVGFNPTIKDSQEKTIEVNIFDFNENIYNETVTVEFIKKLRDEKKFNSIDELKSQLVMDKLKSIQLLT